MCVWVSVCVSRYVCVFGCRIYAVYFDVAR